MMNRAVPAKGRGNEQGQGGAKVPHSQMKHIKSLSFYKADFRPMASQVLSSTKLFFGAFRVKAMLQHSIE